MGEISALLLKGVDPAETHLNQVEANMVVSFHHYTTKSHQLTAFKMLGMNNTYIQYINLKMCVYKLCQACETKLIVQQLS